MSTPIEYGEGFSDEPIQRLSLILPYFDIEAVIDVPIVKGIEEDISRFPIETETEQRMVMALRSRIMTTQPETLPTVDLAIKKIYQYHQSQRRRTGEPYPTHCLFVGNILALWGLPAQIVAAGLLHDTVEDTAYTLEQIQKDFGEEGKMIASHVDDVSEIRGRRTVTATAYKLLKAFVENPGSIFIRAADQFHNAMTSEVMLPRSINRLFQRTINFTAPLMRAFGLPEIARETINFSTKYRYPLEYELIETYLLENNPYTDQIIEGITNKIREALKLSSLAGEIVFETPNLYEVMQSTNWGQDLSPENILLKYDVVYNGDLSDAWVLLSRLVYQYGLPESINQHHQNNKLSLDYWLNELKNEDKLEFIYTIEGRKVHFRLLSRADYEFEQTPLLPLFKVEQQAEPTIAKADEKLSRLQTSWERWHKKKAKSITIREFIRFLEGARSIVVKTPPTEDYPSGSEFELPAGATAYDLIASLPLPRRLKNEMIRNISEVLITSPDGYRRTLTPFYAPLPTGLTVEIKTAKARTFTPEMLKNAVTWEGQKNLRRVAKQDLDLIPGWKEDIQHHGYERIIELYQQASGRETIDFPIQNVAKAFARHTKQDWEILKKAPDRKSAFRKKMILRQQFRTAIELEFGLHAETTSFQDAFITELVRYRDSLIPLPITTFDKEGLDSGVAAIFARMGINVITKEIKYPKAGMATIITFIEPDDKERVPEIMTALEKFKIRHESLTEEE